MRNYLILIVFFASLQIASAQVEEAKDSIVKELDNKYREDQFYVSITYNLLGDKPEGVSQSGFSSGFHLGFIRDFPINKRRNIAFGVGLGLSSNSFNHNFLISKDSDGEFNYSVLDKSEVNYSKNKFATYMVEVPLQLRWRTSTAEEGKFWRIYAGVNVGYVLFNSSKFRGDLGTIKHSKIDSFNDLQYGLTMSAGFNTWNVYVYYGLNSIMSNARIDSESVDMNALKVGLIFYIL
ncbi:PorT family protein [Bizionia argentinensis JUB59]|uniref:PorT family protein n=1 Tax=Bizionia argentinensis JUB59 TaxID=1046627 RepID=G2ECQ6_9FLAO|nr:porin family protein [Bizionia argentinensis]EGV43771.2 PorT family protein [Bizionia argentinensis JUB59]